MTNIDGDAGRFYNGASYTAQEFEGFRGLARSHAAEFRLPVDYARITDEAIAERLEAFNHPPEVIEEGSYRFEIKRWSAEPAEAARLFVSTFSSALTNGNGPGNAYEQAVRSLYRNDELEEVYVGSPGNGHTSSFSPKERREFAKTGRLTYEEGGVTKVFPIVEALVRALKKSDIHVRKIDGDSFGVLLGTACGVEIGGNQVVSLFGNGRPQFSDLGAIGLISGAVVEHTRGTGTNERKALDRFAVTDEKKDIARQLAPALFDNFGGANLRKEMILPLIKGLGRGGRHGDPLLRDTTAFLRSNSDAKVTMVYGAQDRIMGSKHIHARAHRIVQVLSTVGNKSVSLVVLPENHSWHTYMPGLRAAIEDRYSE
jgi:hypothetical protein